MRRRDFLKTTGAAAAAATTVSGTAHAGVQTDARAVAAPAVAKGAKELRLAMPWPDAVSGPADQARRLAQRIGSLSEGRYRITFAAGVGSGLEAVRSGDADLYFSSEHDHLDANRALAYFAGLPGDRGMHPRHLAAWLLVGGGQTLWDDLAGDFGVKAILAGHTGDQARFLATRRIDTMGGLAGQKVSVVGLARDVVRGFGLEPVAVAPSGLAGALARGDILGAELGGAITIHAMGLVGAAPYWAGTSINRHGSALSLGMRRALWDGLSATDQTIVTTAAAAELQLALAEDESHRRLLAPDAPAARTWPIAQDLARTVTRVADAVVAHVAALDVQAQRVNAGYTSFRRAVLGDEGRARGIKAV